MSWNVLEKAERGEHVKVCAFGASNTQRYLPGMHWFDYVELGFKTKYGGECGEFLNAGISGNSAKQLIERFDRDVAFFKPDLTIVTIGGNDAYPEKAKIFRSNLLEICSLLAGIGSEILLQTYYACDLEREPKPRSEYMPVVMDIVRSISREVGVELNDNDVRWARLRETDVELYRTLMLNPMHVNADGNMVIGLDLMRRFGFELPYGDAYFRTGLFAQHVLDMLEPR